MRQIVPQILQGDDELLDGSAGCEPRLTTKGFVTRNDLALIGQLQAVEQTRLLVAAATFLLKGGCQLEAFLPTGIVAKSPANKPRRSCGSLEAR